MIAVEPMQAHHQAALLAVELTPEQVKFAGTASDFWADTRSGISRYLITWQGQVIGFFKIDFHYSNHYDFCRRKALGLRAYAIDRRQQGKGYGSQAVAALLAHLKPLSVDFPCIYLTVNAKNPGAIRCYQKGGFTDTGEHYLGGKAGPQHIMYANL
ncbi:GNAT family N-acetyltransferase [Gallaecimonas mangrovi]|uniref:GNAT family N-acetyltransferase n=1 Tax=Gallaecimonas mangrovi TaxID=2291597 RepID=UPI000E20188F|nr:GNAT family protein [Gallaecimonas mangrovi]